MLYSGLKAKNSGSSDGEGGSERHQERLSLRVPQAAIDKVVDSNPLRCTHFDAWRFFHPDAQSMNLLNPLTRSSQAAHEQPGCVHANMDLFRYAYELYPLLSSELLISALRLAIKSRQIDMRASPYDVSMFEGCEDALCIETAEGRRKYVAEQEQLFLLSVPVRQGLLEAYNQVLKAREAAV